jgi:hypothetical protein
LDKNAEDFTTDEKNCLRNCSAKYVEQFNILNTFQNDYIKYFGLNIFLTDDKQIQAMDRFTKLVNENI